jgi:hypothetical protein
MHIEWLSLKNIRYLDDQEMDFRTGQSQLRKWNFLPMDRATVTLLRVLALTGLGRLHAQFLAQRFPPRLPARASAPALIEFIQVRHAPQERGLASPARRHLCWQVSRHGQSITACRPRAPVRDPSVLLASPPQGRSNRGWLLLGYAKAIQAQRGTDRFAIYPDQRLTRCAGLFSATVRLTDPVAFIQRLYHKARFRDGRARALLARLSTDLQPWLGWDLADTPPTTERFKTRWQATAAPRRAAVTVALDMVRHALDASAKLDDDDPLQSPGVVLLHQIETWCPPADLPRFLTLLDDWFPRMQFFVALSPAGQRRSPARLATQQLALPVPKPRPPPVPPPRWPRQKVALIDVDGSLPNLALMKLCRHFKSQGRQVGLVRGVAQLPRADTVLASCVFHSPGSERRLAALRRHYGEDLQLGGSGVDLRLRLPPEIEALTPDYTLYPELGGRAIGFLTRGCPRRCPFCVVPLKEGPPRRVSDLDALLQGRQQLILLDDNLLAHADGVACLEEMARRNLAVNFNQTLDLRLLTPASAALLRRIRCANVSFTRRVLHFSLNDTRHLDQMQQCYTLLQTSRRDNVEFVCMYGCNTSLAEDVARFRFLRALPGAYVFVQQYQPVPVSAAPDLSRLFDDQADSLMDELVRIIFPQNMKSMEKYYRWLAIQYARQRGRIHARLIETLFRYNGRDRMGGLLQRLQEYAKQASRHTSTSSKSPPHCPMS